MEADRAPAGGETLAAPVSRRPFSVGGAFTRREWLALAGIALLYVVVVVLVLRRGPLLGWDESVYSLRARDFAGGATPRHYWEAYRAPGLPWLLHLLWGWGSHPTVFRLAVAAFGLGLVVVAWLLTRHLFGRRAGLVAAAGMALTPPLVLASTQVWPDVPGAAMGLLAVALFVFATGGERPSWWMLAAVPAIAAATYLRFGAPLPILIGLLGVALWRRRVLLRHPLPAALTALAGTVAVAGILLVPSLTGSGSAAFGAVAGYPRTALEGFGDYLTLAHQVIGPAAVVLGLAGLAASLWWAFRDGRDRGAVLTAAGIGLATALVLAVILHGEVRYLSPAYPWLWVAGAPGLERLARAWPRAVQGAIAGVVVLVLALAAVGAGRERNRDLGTEQAVVRRAAEAIAAQAEGRPCLVVASRVPQVIWYSGCDATTFDLGQVRLPARPGTVTFMLLIGGDRRQPEGDLLAAYRAAAGDPSLVIEGHRPAEVYRLQGVAAGG
jgi:4-amino-4-deoxy-L-arabinose transferase-like glycosyltransferase